MGYGKRQLEVRGYRGQIPSPGRPTVAWRQDRVQFWAAIAAGAMTEDAAAEAGVSSPVRISLCGVLRVPVCVRLRGG